MGKCINCGSNFVGTTANPPGDSLCRYCERDELKQRVATLEKALSESLKLQSHYASLLNQWDGGHRIGFDSAEAWIRRLRETKTLPAQPTKP